MRFLSFLVCCALTGAATARPVIPPPPADPTPIPNPTPTPTPTVGPALDAAAEGYVETGEFSFGAQPLSLIPRPPVCLAGDPMSNAIDILRFVHAHRFVDVVDVTDQMVLDLITADPVVAAQYGSLISSGTLSTDAAVDLDAVLNHSTLVENYGAAGPVAAAGAVLVSTGVSRPCAPPIPNCRNDLGGIISWPNEWRPRLCQPNGCNQFQEAMVWLTVTTNGSTYRAMTTSRPCGCPPFNNGANTFSGYAFANVPTGTATVVARPIMQCCRVGTTTRSITCPPGPRSLRPCVPLAVNVIADFAMGPWTPPVVCGTVHTPTNSLTEVFLGTRESSCTSYGSDSVTVEELPYSPNFLIRSCLPSHTYLYAKSGTYWAELDIPDVLGCGEVYSPNCGISLNLTPAPCFSGRITNMQPCMAGHYFVEFIGCAMSGCGSVGSRRQLAGIAADGTFNSGQMLAPGTWDAHVIYLPDPQNVWNFQYVGSFNQVAFPQRLAAGTDSYPGCHPLGDATVIVHCR